MGLSLSSFSFSAISFCWPSLFCVLYFLDLKKSGYWLSKGLEQKKAYIIYGEVHNFLLEGLIQVITRMKVFVCGKFHNISGSVFKEEQHFNVT